MSELRRSDIIFYPKIYHPKWGLFFLMFISAINIWLRWSQKNFNEVFIVLIQISPLPIDHLQ